MIARYEDCRPCRPGWNNKLEIYANINQRATQKVPNRHPLKVSADSIHLALVYTDTAVLFEGVLGVVEVARPVAIAIVGDLYS